MSLFFLVGIGFLLYPTVANWYNESHASSIQADYNALVDSMEDDETERFRSEAEAYNQDLNDRPNQFFWTDEDHIRYEETLDVTGTGVMGSVTIPSLGVSLPIYHGTDSSVLSIAVGHVEGSSLPIGGKNTHTLLSAHRGLPSAKLFTSLNLMEKGDVFTVESLGEIHTYQVENIWTVQPEDFTHLYVRSGEDLCTLITCTPYGVNTHRLLVQGRRVDTGADVISFDDDSAVSGHVHLIYLVEYAALAVLIVLGVLVFVVLCRKRVRKDEAVRVTVFPKEIPFSTSTTVKVKPGKRRRKDSGKVKARPRQ